MKRENVAVRAIVEDSPEHDAYYAELERHAAGALWTVANEIEPWYPQPKSAPMLWKWRATEPLVRKAPELVSAEKAARPVGVLVTPGPKGWGAAVGLLFTRAPGMDPRAVISA